MGKSEERRPPESGREPGENTAVAGLIMGIAAVVFWFFGYSAVASVVLGILGLVWTDKAKKEGYTGDKRTIAFVLSLVGLIGGLVVLIITVILINVLAVPGITALRDMLGMIGEMAMISEWTALRQGEVVKHRERCFQQRSRCFFVRNDELLKKRKRPLTSRIGGAIIKYNHRVVR